MWVTKERSSDLLDRQRFEVGQRGESRSEVVEQRPRPSSPNRARTSPTHTGSARTVFSVISSISAPAGSPCARERCCDLGGKLCVLQVSDRRVDGYVQVQAGLPPSPHLRKGGLEHSGVSARPSPISSAAAMNRAGSIIPRVGWRQRASASAPTILRVWASALGW